MCIRVLITCLPFLFVVFSIQADDTDLTPLLIISEASVEHLNTHIPEKDIPIKRFRPNIIVSGCEPHDEVSLVTNLLTIIMYGSIDRAAVLIIMLVESRDKPVAIVLSNQ